MPEFGVIHVTLDGRVISCDDGDAALLGLAAENAIGRQVAEFTDGDASGGPDAMINILVRTGEPMSIRRTFVRPNGARVPCRIQLCLILGAQGRPHSVVGVGQIVPETAR